MTAERRWKAEISVDEHEDHSHAEARLVVADGGISRPVEPLRGTGQAHRRTGGVAVQEIEDELAVSHARWDLAHVVRATAVTGLETVVSGSAVR